MTKLHPLPKGIRRWDLKAFEAWVADEFQDQPKINAAKMLGLSHRTFWAIWLGQRAPGLGNYCNMIASAGLPFGTWLRVKICPKCANQNDVTCPHC